MPLPKDDLVNVVLVFAVFACFHRLRANEVEHHLGHHESPYQGSGGGGREVDYQRRSGVVLWLGLSK